MPRTRRLTVTARLVALIEPLEPFLDKFGATYCRMPHADREQRMLVPLCGNFVRDLLFHRYRREHNSCPTWKQIAQAIADVRGKLLESWAEPALLPADPTLLAILKVLDLRESWVGSSKELLTLLNDVDRIHNVLGPGEKLPQNEDAMGIWLRNNYQPLRAKGIELLRLKPHRLKRLWLLRKVSDRDTCDTLAPRVSPEVVTPNQNADNEKRPIDTCDTLNEEHRVLLNILNNGGNP